MQVSSFKLLTALGCSLALAGCGAKECLTDNGSTAGGSALISNAGENQIVPIGSLVALSAQQSDMGSDTPINFEWTLDQAPSLSLASLFGRFLANPTFTADKEGDYCAKLNVYEDGNTATDYVKIQAVSGNIAPIAKAGGDVQTASVSMITLNGSESFDNNNDQLSYAWTLVSKPTSSSAVLNNANTTQPTIVPDVVGDYDLQLIVNDGEVNSAPDTVRVSFMQSNLPPVANAGDDQNVESATFTLNGSNSTDPEGAHLTYEWKLVSRPRQSQFELAIANQATMDVEVDAEGSYLFDLAVTDSANNTANDRVLINFDNPSSGTIFEDFDRDGDIPGVVTNNASALPDVKSVDGRYRANLTNNAGNVTLHFHEDQGRLDAWRTRFPFEVVARNIGIGTQSNSQTPHPFVSGAFNFAGIQVHSLSLDSPDSAHVVVGHRGNIAPFTIEGKNTVSGRSSVNDIGSYTVRSGRADIRIVGDENGGLTVYWQQPNMDANKELSDNWNLYRGTGQLPGTQANFGSKGSEVYVGLITYAYQTKGIPFVGTCDSVTITEK